MEAAAAVVAAEADADAGSVVIGIAVIGAPGSIDSAIVIRCGAAESGLRPRLVGSLLIIIRRHIAEGLRRAIGCYHDGVIHAEGQNLFGINQGGMAAGQQHSDDPGCSARAGTDSCSFAPVPGPGSARADDRADTSGRADTYRVTAFRSSSVAVYQFGFDGDLAAIDQGQI